MLVRLNDSLDEDLLIEDPIIKTDIDQFLYGRVYAPLASYIFMMIFTGAFTFPALAMREPNVLIREKMSSLSNTNRNLQFFIGCLSLSVLVWILSNLLAAGLYGFELFTNQTGQLFLASNLLMTFGLSGMCYLIAVISPNKFFANFVQVAVSLAVAFGSGLFTGLDLVSESFQTVVSFASPIWQVRANRVILSGLTDQLSANQLDEISHYFLIMLLMGFAYYAIAFVILRNRNLQQN